MNVYQCALSIITEIFEARKLRLPRYNPYQYLNGDLPPQPPEALKKRRWVSLSDRVKGERYDMVFLKRHFTLAAFDACEGSRFFINRF